MARPKRLEWFEREAIAVWLAAGYSTVVIAEGMGVSHMSAYRHSGTHGRPRPAPAPTTPASQEQRNAA